MSEALRFLLSWAAGVFLGAIFFGGLWWTVRKGLYSKQPALWFLCSQLIRTGVALTGLYLVSGGYWQRLLLCLLGFVMARPGVMWLTRPPRENQAHTAQSASHAP